MQDHRFDFVVQGTPDEVWDVMWQHNRAGFESDSVKI
jgi:hypothetical protein